MAKKKIFETGTMSLGVNYWASHAATRMWTEWDETVVEKDIQKLSEIGCEYLRVFPLWPDFQPVMVLRTNCFKGGYKRSYAFVNEQPLPKTDAGRAGVDEKMMQRFEKLLDIAQKYNMKVIVPLINGHMTFRIYNPPAVDGLDHFRDPESLMWQGKFVRYFVKRMKHHPAICAWEIGNESNCLSVADDRATAWSWTAFITDAIRSQDQTRPVCSGMHSLELHDTHDKHWTFFDQSELCDVLTSHPYPMWREYVNCDKPNTLRWVLFAAAENQVYLDFTNSEAMAEEVGTLRRTFSTFEDLGDSLRNMLWLLWNNDSRALFWWCAFDQTKMEFPPYDWDEAGMEHGLMTTDYMVNPTGRAISDFAAFKKKCPIKSLNPPREKAVCIFGRNQGFQKLALSTNILAMQAGIPLKFCFCESEIPDANVYLIPCVMRKGGLDRSSYRMLDEKVKNGATVYMSLDYNACLPLMDEFLGFEISMREKCDRPLNIHIKNKLDITLYSEYKFEVKSCGAVPIDDGGIVLEFKKGKGKIITVLLPFEKLMINTVSSYQTLSGYELYRIIGEKIIENNVLKSNDCEVLVTEHPKDKNTVYAIICNCSPVAKRVALDIKDGWTAESFYSDTECSYDDGILNMTNNSGLILVLKKVK